MILEKKTKKKKNSENFSEIFRMFFLILSYFQKIYDKYLSIYNFGSKTEFMYI